MKKDKNIQEAASELDVKKEKRSVSRRSKKNRSDSSAPAAPIADAQGQAAPAATEAEVKAESSPESVKTVNGDGAVKAEKDSSAKKSKPKKEKTPKKKKEVEFNPDKPPLFLRAADPETVILVSVVIGLLALATYFILASFTTLTNVQVAMIVTLVYALLAVLILLRTRITVRQYNELRDRLVRDQSVMTELLRGSHIPAILTHDDGTVVWFNDAMRSALNIGDVHIIGKKLEKFCPINVRALIEATRNPSDPDRIALAAGSMEKLEDNTNEYGISSSYPRTANGIGGIECFIGEKRYLARAYSAKFPSKDKNGGMRSYNLTVLEDNSELFTLKDKIENENLVVAYVILDNLTELAQYARIDYRMAANNIEIHLKDWANEIGGVMCEYDRDKYMLLIHQDQLIKCIEEDFPVLEKIRAEKLGNTNMSITISMGISGYGATVSAREQNAQLALDTALRRGGDQIAIKKEDGFEFIGGRSKSSQIREKVDSRINAKLLIEKLAGYSKVMIMGHKNPDCDSIGACIGMSRFVRSKAAPETDVRIIVNTSNETFLTCTEALYDHPDHRNTFIEGLDALDIIDDKTLLIVVDVNNFNIAECPDLVRSIESVAVIDHHRKSAEFTRPLVLEYIDPSASSTSELITEMIESELTEGELLNEEANVLLAGIMLDTMNFTRTAGVRTYSAAYFLRANGARAEEARLFFTENIEQHKAEAVFFAPENIVTFRQCIAVAKSLGTGAPEYDRIAAAKAAERLIATKGIEAAFTLVKIGDSIVISARSNGNINVQLILEELRGGGHFDAAGAQVNAKSMKEVQLLLRNAIDHYFSEE